MLVTSFRGTSIIVGEHCALAVAARAVEYKRVENFMVDFK
jgi:hypothetical protein